VRSVDRSLVSALTSQPIQASGTTPGRDTQIASEGPLRDRWWGFSTFERVGAGRTKNRAYGLPSGVLMNRQPTNFSIADLISESSVRNSHIFSLAEASTSGFLPP
jgi:hypothetical protein